MPDLGIRIAKRTQRITDKCVLLIEAEAGDAARLLSELSLATDEGFRVHPDKTHVARKGSLQKVTGLARTARVLGVSVSS